MEKKLFRKWTDKEFIDAVKSSEVLKEIYMKLNVKRSDRMFIEKHAKRLSLDLSHIKWGFGKRKLNNVKRPLSEILTINSSYYSTHHLKCRLLNEGLLAPYCDICKLSIWLGKLISLQLNHINGNRSDNRIENLQILCPNCHSQTANYAGKKNKGIIRARKNVCIDCGKFISKKALRCRTCNSLNKKNY